MIPSAHAPGLGRPCYLCASGVTVDWIVSVQELRSPINALEPKSMFFSSLKPILSALGDGLCKHKAQLEVWER